MSIGVPGAPFPSSKFTDAGVGGNHILYDPKEKYVKQRGQTASCYVAPG